MSTFNINSTDITDDPHNVRASQADVEAIADSIVHPQSDIMVRPVQSVSGTHYEIANGHARLAIILDLHGKALVRVAVTGEQFYVGRDANGGIVRL